MNDAELVARYPRAYHLAYGPEVWPSIQRHGLLSVAALLDRWDVPPATREQLLRQHRPGPSRCPTRRTGRRTCEISIPSASGCWHACSPT